MVLHAMLVSIQSSIDIATEIIAMKGFRRPQSYRDTFGILADEGILSLELARPLSALPAFVEYPCPSLPAHPDLAQVYGILQRDLPLLKEFLSEMKTFAHAGYYG